MHDWWLKAHDHDLRFYCPHQKQKTHCWSLMRPVMKADVVSGHFRDTTNRREVGAACCSLTTIRLLSSINNHAMVLSVP